MSQSPNWLLPMQTTAPGVEQETEPLTQAPLLVEPEGTGAEPDGAADGTPEGAAEGVAPDGAAEATAEEPLAGPDGAAPEGVASDGAPLTV